MTLIPARFRPCSRPLPWLRPAPPRRNIRNAPSTWWCLAAGGPTDNVARSLAEAMRPTLGQTVVVENKGGAGGTIGTTQVARAQPDGYSVLLMHAGFSTAPSLYKNPGYDPTRASSPSAWWSMPMTIIARSDFPPNNIQELAEYVKRTRTRSRWPTPASAPPATCAAPCWSKPWACNC